MRFWPIDFATSAAIVSAIAAIAALYFANKSFDYSTVASLRDQIGRYTAEYSTLVKDYPDNDFKAISFNATRSDYRLRADILAGMLVQVVDTMNEIGDKRAKRWSQFLNSFEGPLLDPDFTLEDYASNELTMKSIDAARQNARAKKLDQMAERCAGAANNPSK